MNKLILVCMVSSILCFSGCMTSSSASRQLAEQMSCQELKDGIDNGFEEEKSNDFFEKTLFGKIRQEATSEYNARKCAAILGVKK